ncbi:MAG: alkaline phosphatase family protein [Bacteroidales bacterium]|nr:alkaline phosphatase family protein [Bacteroidales bacterium]
MINKAAKELILTILFLAGTMIPAGAQQNASLCPEKPKLVLVLLIDNLNSQQMEIVRSQVGAKGFNRVCGHGTLLTDAYYDTGGNFAGKNVATLFTGAPAATHGIVARQWIDSFSNKRIDAIYGELKTSKEPDTLAKPANGALLCGTIGNEIRKIYNQEAKIFSIGFNPELLLWASGTKNGEPMAWLDKRTGKFVSANIGKESTLAWIEDFNSKGMIDNYRQRTWGPRKDINLYHQSKYFPESVSGNTFLYQLDVAYPKLGRYGAVCGSPFANSLVRDMAAAAIVYEEMGKDDIPDILTVQFSAIPTLGERMQPLDPQTEDMLLGLDENIASLLQMIDGTVGMDNTLVVMTASQGAYDVSATDSPYWGEKGVVSMRRASALLNLYLMALYGQEAWVKNYSPGSIYIDKELCEKKKINVDTVLRQSADFLTQVKGIGDAIIAKDIKYITSTSPVVEAMRHNYHPKRSGDILVYLEPGWAEEIEDGRKLTQLWNGEFVPLVFYGWKIPRATIYERHSMTDVAPTICSFIRVANPNGCSGVPIPIVDYKDTENKKH